MSERDGLVRQAASAFERAFHRSPAWHATAPGRVNLIGEHTDYNAGYVLPLAIDRWCVCIGTPAAGEVSCFTVPDIDATIEVSLRDLAARGHAAASTLPDWARYLAGSIIERASTLGVQELPEFDVLAMSTVPVGGGLSSSAAIETAGAALLEAVLGVGESSTAWRLGRALDCQRAEHRWAGVPCGLMDQIAASFGSEGHALRIDCRGNTVEPVPMPGTDEAVVLVVNSGVRHALASGEYARRRAACEAAAQLLGVTTLREIGTLDAVGWSCLDDEQTRCVRHVVSENARVLHAAEALRSGDLNTLGTLMVQSHASLRDDYRVSCPELDAIAELASATQGVFGARMTGGGFGGCAVVLATPQAADAVQHNLPSRYRAATRHECDIWPVTASSGAVAGSC